MISIHTHQIITLIILLIILEHIIDHQRYEKIKNKKILKNQVVVIEETIFLLL